MRRNIIISLALMFHVLVLNSQQPTAYQEVDKLTYDLYIEEDWKELIKAGRDALHQGFDYYYLRMRIGIAYYETGNYHASISHFVKAREFSPDNVTALEYLYYSYLFSGRQMDALHLSREFPDILNEKTGLSAENPIKSISASYSQSNYNTQDLTEGEWLSSVTADDGFQSIPEGFGLGAFSLSHKAGYSVIISHSLQYLAKTNRLAIRSGGLDYYINEQNVGQFQYYISPAIRLGKGFTISPAFHYLSYKVPGITFTSPGWGGSRPSGVSYRYTDYVVSLSAGKYFPYVFAGLSFAYGSLNEKKQLQPGAEISIYPLGNLNLYSSFRTFKVFEDTNEENGRNGFVIQNTTGFKVFKSLWLEGEGSFGDFRNGTEYNGATVYNGLEIVKDRYTARAIALFKQGKVQLIISYTNTEFENYYKPAQGSEIVPAPVNYKSNTITGGLLWKM